MLLTLLQLVAVKESNVLCIATHPHTHTHTHFPLYCQVQTWGRTITHLVTVNHLPFIISWYALIMVTPRNKHDSAGKRTDESIILSLFSSTAAIRHCRLLHGSKQKMVALDSHVHFLIFVLCFLSLRICCFTMLRCLLCSQKALHFFLFYSILYA